MKRVPLAALLLVACGHRSDAPEAAAAARPATPPPETAPTTKAPAPPPEQPRPSGRPFEIHNSCSDVAEVAFGEDPAAPTAGRRTVAPGGTIDGPRDASGNMTVSLLDKGEPLLKVRVTRGMKRVEIGRSCRTLDAR